MADQLLKDLFKAYFDARKNKRNTCNALEFEIDYERKIFDLYYDLKNNTYKLSRSIAFIVNHPVKREVIASSFRDRVIHHLIFNYINPVFEPKFINDSYNLRQIIFNKRLSLNFNEIFKHKRGYKKVNLTYFFSCYSFLTLEHFCPIINIL